MNVFKFQKGKLIQNKHKFWSRGGCNKTYFLWTCVSQNVKSYHFCLPFLGKIWVMFINLVAQSSATGVTVAAIPPCSAICFRNPKVPRYPPPARRAPCLLRMRGKCDRGVRRKVWRLDLGACSAILARHLWFCGNLMRHSMRDTVWRDWGLHTDVPLSS